MIITNLLLTLQSKHYAMTHELPQLKSGNDWLEYMIANGWTLLDSFVGDEIDGLTLTKDSHRIEYSNSYKNGTCFIHSRMSGTGKWFQVHYIRGDVEADFGKFMFLAHSLGWVDIRDAAAMFERVTGTDLLAEIKAQLI